MAALQAARLCAWCAWLFSFASAKQQRLIITQGDEHAAFFRRAELAALVDVHRVSSKENEDPLTEDETNIIKGCLNMREKSVRDVMTNIQDFYMLPATTKLNDFVMTEVESCSFVPNCLSHFFVLFSQQKMLSSGHSRIPIYTNNKTDTEVCMCVCVCFKQRLIFPGKMFFLLRSLIKVDPEDNVPVTGILSFPC